MGQDAIEFVACALDVPLYRKVISGDAVEQGSEYGARNPQDLGGVMGDETEDLYSLLLTVKVYLSFLKRQILINGRMITVTPSGCSRSFSRCNPLQLSAGTHGTCVRRDTYGQMQCILTNIIPDVVDSL